MERTTIAANIRLSPHIALRVEAIVDKHRWDDPAADPTLPIPTAQILSRIASDDGVLDGVESRMNSAETEGAAQAAVLEIPDDELTPLVLSALNRLTP